MSIHHIPGTEPEPVEAFDWHHEDILTRPPYSHYDMVIALAEGRFCIEGEQSDITDAQMYADHHADSPEVFRALDDYQRHFDLALNGVW